MRKKPRKDIAEPRNAKSKMLVVLPMRAFGQDEMKSLCQLLTVEPAITELKASGKDIGHEGARALGVLLGNGRCALRRLAIGNSTFASDGGLHELLCGALENAVSAGESPSRCPLRALDFAFKDLRASDVPDLSALLGRC